MITQRTIKDSVSAVGVGLHKGEKVQITLRPAPANTGIIFQRVDLNPVVSIKASPEAVGETTLCTCLVNEQQVKVSTVEHLLSAVAGLGIDNLIVDVDADFQGSQDWYDQFTTNEPSKTSPWYHLLIDEESTMAYVSEQNIYVDSSNIEIDHPMVDDVFADYKAGHYLPRQTIN